MVYNPDIPQAQTDLSVSQGDLLENFSQLNTQFGINHVEFNDTGGDAGKHKLVTFIEQSSDPATKSNEAIIFAKDDSGDTELFIRPENNAAPYQMTKDGLVYLGITPFASVNFDRNNPYIQGTSPGVASVAMPTPGVFRVNFTAAVTALLAGSNDYFWSVSGFDNSTNPVISQVSNNFNYNSVVTDTFIQFSFVNQNNSPVTALTRACAVFWRFQ